MSERDWDKITEQRRRICLVACRQCEQKAGDPCRMPSGGIVPPHGSRRADAAAAGYWTPGEPLTATQESP